MDTDDLIPVGGRLKHVQTTYNNGHQILLSKDHNLSELIAQDLHVRYFHYGSQQLLYPMREKYWPISGYILIKGVTRLRVKCFEC